MDIPIQLFFSLYREGVKIEARQHSELADLYLIPKMNLDYYFGRKERYQRIIDPKAKVLPPKPGGPVLEAGSSDAMRSMRSIGLHLRRAMGYGGR